MNIVYVLLVITQVHTGAVFNSQEFSTQAACDTARGVVVAALANRVYGYRPGVIGEAHCVPKGEKQ